MPPAPTTKIGTSVTLALSSSGRGLVSEEAIIVELISKDFWIIDFNYSSNLNFTVKQNSFLNANCSMQVLQLLNDNLQGLCLHEAGRRQALLPMNSKVDRTKLKQANSF
jgi:hypothetical protein